MSGLTGAVFERIFHIRTHPLGFYLDFPVNTFHKRAFLLGQFMLGHISWHPKGTRIELSDTK